MEIHALKSLLMSRWPKVASALDEAVLPECEAMGGSCPTLRVRGVQLTSRLDRASETKAQLARLPETERTTLFGPAMGDLAEAVLTRSTLKRLDVVLLNRGVFRVALENGMRTAWLSDPRTEVHLAAEWHELGDSFFATPPELVLAEPASWKLRDRILLEQGRQIVDTWFRADNPVLQERLRENQSLIAEDPSPLTSLPRIQSAIVIASGPSLGAAKGLIQNALGSATRPWIVAVDTALKPLLEMGMRPDAVVSIDEHVTPERICVDQSAGIELVYFPLVKREVLERWRGNRSVAYSSSPVFAELRRNLPRTELFAGGSVIHPAVDLAVRLGARTVTLVGADFAFLGEQTHAGWSSGELAPALRHASLEAVGQHGEILRTSPNLAGYLCELERYIKKHEHVQFLNASRTGAPIAGCEPLPEVA